jgi:signal transduction histidine kinase
VLQRGKKANDKEGQGLGLAMVVDTIKLYGGEIRIESNPWGGTRIEIGL